MKPSFTSIFPKEVSDLFLEFHHHQYHSAMAKNSAETRWVYRKVYTFAQLLEVDHQTKSVVSSSTKAQPPVKVTEPRCGEKRKLEVELGEQGKSMNGKKQRIEIDRFKKLQCSVVLKRLMVHPYGFAFKKTVDPKRPIDLEMIKFKLDRGLYLGTDQFADDVRLLFSNAILYYHLRNKIHNMAKKLREVFEVKWKSLNEEWATEKSKGDKSMMTKESEPSRNLKLCSIDENVRHNSLQQPVSMESALSKKELMKPKHQHFLDTILASHERLTKESEPSRKPKQGSIDENVCPNSLRQDISMESALSKKDLKKPKQQHFLDTILASQQRLLDFGGRAEMQRKRQREAARVALQQMERTAFIDDNLKSFRELELMCGHSLSYCINANPLENLGLFLKTEFMAANGDEEGFLNGDWDLEDGEISC